MAEKRKSKISGKRHRPRPISLGVEQFGKLGEEEGEPAIERKREYTVFEFNWGEREEQVVCNASVLVLALTDEARGDVSLAIFIASVSGSESLASFTNRTFHLSRPPGFRRAFVAAERNGRFGRIQCQRGKESSSRGKRKRRIFFRRRTVRVKVGGKVIPASFLKVEGRGTLVGAKDRRERDR